jgi:hypothetical protein
MSQLRTQKTCSNLEEKEALLFENAQLRRTAAELLLQTSILREQLLLDRTEEGLAFAKRLAV